MNESHETFPLGCSHPCGHKVGYRENDRAAQTTPLSQQVFLKPLCVSLCAKPKGAHVQDPHTLMSSQSREDEGQ